MIHLGFNRPRPTLSFGFGLENFGNEWTAFLADFDLPLTIPTLSDGCHNRPFELLSGGDNAVSQNCPKRGKSYLKGMSKSDVTY